MKNRDQYKRLFRLLSSVIILLIQTIIFASIWYSYYDRVEVLYLPFFRRGNYVVIGLYCLISFLFYKLYGCFNIGQQKILDTLYAQIISVLCINAVTYLQLSLIGHFSFLSHIEPILKMTIIDIILVFVWVLLTRWIVVRLYPPRELVLVYGEYDPENLIQKIASRDDKYTIMETVRYDENMDTIQEKILHYGCAVFTDIPSKPRNALLKFCFRNDIRCYSVPKISDIMIMSAENIHLFDTSLLLFRNKGLSIEQRVFKRMFDIIGSIVALTVLSPLMLLIAVCIKLYDRGPVFFTQDRLTQDGAVFKLIKFRSMRMETGDTEYCMTRKNDARITPVGKVLRRIHFDELPQLINILKGDMSFVGPRPECPDIAEQYRQSIPEFDFRLKVKAGLTGFAQVHGKYNTTPYDKLKLDLTYIENYSFWLDMKLIMLTIKVLLQKENTEGIESWQKTAATKDMEKDFSKQQ